MRAPCTKLYRRSMRAAGVGLAAAIFVAGCASVEKEEKVSTSFQALAKEYFDGYFAFNPTWATYTGIHDHDGRIEDWSPEAVQGELKRLRTAAKRLMEMGPENLTADDRLDFAILSSHIRAQLFDLEEIRPFESNPIRYNSILCYSIDELLSKEFAPKADRLRRIIEREGEFGRFIADARTNLQNPPRVFTEKAIELVDGTLTFLRETLPDAVSDVKDDSLQDAFRNRNGEAIREVEGFLRFLREDLLPRSNGEFPLGPERFLKKLLLDEMVDLPLEELRAIGDRALEETREAFVATAKEIDPEASPKEVFASLKEDHASAEELIASTAESLEGMRQFLIDHEIVTLPSEERCQVVPMPPFMWGFAAMNSPGPLETVARNAYYYVDPVEDDWSEEKKEEHLREFNRPAMEIISIHEAYPGHFVQLLFQRDVPSLVRKALWSVTYGEGWAHYCEQMMIEEGYGEGDPRFRLAQLSDALIRLCRYRVALGLHTEGMTIDEAQAVFVEQGFQEPYTARREAIRGTFDPLYLNYTLGKMQILDMREAYKEKMGEKFSLRDFHDRLLSIGPVPVKIARQILLGEDAASGP